MSTQVSQEQTDRLLRLGSMPRLGFESELRDIVKTVTNDLRPTTSYSTAIAELHSKAESHPLAFGLERIVSKLVSNALLQPAYLRPWELSDEVWSKTIQRAQHAVWELLRAHCALLVEDSQFADRLLLARWLYSNPKSVFKSSSDTTVSLFNSTALASHFKLKFKQPSTVFLLHLHRYVEVASVFNSGAIEEDELEYEKAALAPVLEPWRVARSSLAFDPLENP